MLARDTAQDKDHQNAIADKYVRIRTYTYEYVRIRTIRTISYLAIFFAKAYVFACIRMYMHVFVRIRTYSYVFVRIRTYPYVSYVSYVSVRIVRIVIYGT
jgi:hypothetical protein